MRIHCISVGGAVMHQIAIALQKLGHIVTGSDDEIYDPAFSNLHSCGIITEDYYFNEARITNDLDLIILGMHARKDNSELLKAQELHIPVVSYPEFTYNFSRSKTRIVVGGSHGKTTTTAMIMHAFQQYSVPFDYLVGAKVEGFETSVHLSKENPYIIIEGDEYLSSCLDHRAKFHWYHPHIAVLTGIAWDHINVYPTFDKYLDAFAQFIQTIEPEGYLIYNEQDETLRQLVYKHAKNIHLIGYYPLPHAYSNLGSIVKFEGMDYIMDIFGSHNFSNMAAAMEACRLAGIKPEIFLQSMISFSLPDKRLNRVFEKNQLIIYRDFAHAPSKARATVHAVREKYPNHQIVAIYELHTYSSMDENFIPYYAHVFDEADQLIVYVSAHSFEIKKKRIIPQEMIKKSIKHHNIDVVNRPEELKEKLNAINFETNQPAVLIFMSSGNFDHFDIIKWIKNC